MHFIQIVKKFIKKSPTQRFSFCRPCQKLNRLLRTNGVRARSEFCHPW
ncbi:hypothetical protein HMPREF9554_01034 [Treponema phagedenis F0421]|nr:hypothetical protein HMPREF9554_01034 [Treponema phagedenis F0421]